MKKIDSDATKSSKSKNITITKLDDRKLKQSLLPKSFVFDKPEDKKRYLSIVDILTSDNETDKQLELLRDCALRFDIDLNHGCLDDWLGVSIFHERDEFREILGMGEIELCSDLNDMVMFWNNAIKGLDVHDDIVFNLNNEDVVHINGGIHSGGFTIYQYDTFVNSFLLKRQSENFRNELSENGITQKQFSELTGVSAQCISKWHRTKFPKWVDLALKGIKVHFSEFSEQESQNN